MLFPRKAASSPTDFYPHFTILVAALLLTLPLASLAHGYWFDVQGSGRVGTPVRVQVCFGEIDVYSVRHREAGPELALTGSFQVYVLDSQGQRTTLKLHPLRDCWEAIFTPKQPGTYRILGLNDMLPVVDRSATGGQNVRPIEYLCAAYVVGNSSTPLTPEQQLDIIAMPQGKLTQVRVFRAGQPVPADTKLRVFNPENWEKMLVTDTQGRAVFSPLRPGLYIIRQDWVDPTPGTYQGTAYVSVRHRCDYCLWVH